MTDLEQFKADRNEALLSLDEHKIRAMYKKWNGFDLNANPEVFWISVHKAITAALDLPDEFRQKSKTWLKERGWTSMDDGDL